MTTVFFITHCIFGISFPGVKIFVHQTLNHKLLIYLEPQYN